MRPPQPRALWVLIMRKHSPVLGVRATAFLESIGTARVARGEETTASGLVQVALTPEQWNSLASFACDGAAFSW